MLEILAGGGGLRALEIWAGGGVFGLGNPGGRGGLVVSEIRVEGGGSKNLAIHRGGGGCIFFSGITH